MSVFIPPDWCNDQAYPTKADDISITQWAWEFLRRNSEYQKDYEHFASLPSYYSNGAKTVKWHRMHAQWWDDPALRCCKFPLSQVMRKITLVNILIELEMTHHSIIPLKII